MKIKEDYYLIIDFEATCCNDNSFPRDEMEIIEFGAVLLNSQSLEIESDYQTFIRPVRHPVLTEFCKELTTIKQADVDQAPDFAAAINSVQAWLTDVSKFRFCSWGGYDKNQLLQDCAYHNITYPFGDAHTNLKKAFAKELKIRKPVGIGSALKRLGLSFEGTAHRGIDDARNIARIVRKTCTRLG